MERADGEEGRRPVVLEVVLSFGARSTKLALADKPLERNEKKNPRIPLPS